MEKNYQEIRLGHSQINVHWETNIIQLLSLIKCISIVRMNHNQEESVAKKFKHSKYYSFILIFRVAFGMWLQLHKMKYYRINCCVDFVMICVDLSIAKVLCGNDCRVQQTLVESNNTVQFLILSQSSQITVWETNLTV